jgi:hypothetical protein
MSSVGELRADLCCGLHVKLKTEKAATIANRTVRGTV